MICKAARKIKAEKNPNDPNLFILVDGAQALGNLPKINFEELGCNAYVGTPHKTMKSEVLVFLLQSLRLRDSKKSPHHAHA